MKKNLLLDVVTVADSESISSEQYRLIRTNIEVQREEKKINSIMVCSASSGEGKTTTSVNLAVVFAATNNRVLLIDLDLRKRGLTEAFRLRKAPGFCGILEEGRDNIQSIYKSNVPGLDFLPAGKYKKNPAELLSSNDFKEIMEVLSLQYDMIIIDVPPVVEVADASIIARSVDGVILVVREDFTNMKYAIEVRDSLANSGSNMLGVVYNGTRLLKAGYYGYEKR